MVKYVKVHRIKGFPTVACEVCGKPAERAVRDLVAREDPLGIRYLPDLRLHYLCPKHFRERRIIDQC